ncbi:MAG: hypothetical protein EAZ89_02895, partial [Bacteroidetes bacterium]
PGSLLLGLEMAQRRLPNDYTHKRQLLESQLGEIETLILGSSHSYLALDPGQFEEKTFNLASTAQTLYFDQYLLDRYIDQMPKLRRVIVPVSYSSLAAESDRLPDDFNKSYYFAHFYDSEAFTNPFSFKKYSLTALWGIKASVDRSFAYAFRGDSLVECRRNGWYATEEQRDLLKNGRESGRFQDRFYDERLFSQNLGYIEQMIRRCREKQVAIYLISTPMWKTFMANTQPGRYAKMVYLTDSLAHAQGVPYWNFSTDERFGEEDFFDSNHLRTQGAVKFSRILTGRMK